MKEEPPGSLHSYVIIVNWNGWRDTIECLESVFRQEYRPLRVIVCDNASADQSLDHIAEWARGGIAASCTNSDLRHLTYPPIPKPIPFVRVDAGEHIALGSRDEALFLVQTGANLGFSGGNNVGLRLALDAGDLEYAWLLNNDTVVHPDALSALVARMNGCPEAGLCGSTLLYYHAPNSIQALGGSVYRPWLARVGQIGLGSQISQRPGRAEVERQMKYVAGASLFVSRNFLEQVGLMNESYFLYFEEIDWATRAAGRFRMVYSPESIVYHKEGSSIGTSNIKGKRRSLLSEQFASRNRVIFTKKYYPWMLPTVISALLLSALHRLLTGQFQSFLVVLRSIASGLLFSPDTTAAIPSSANPNSPAQYMQTNKE